jgi:hypothetical protein
LVGRQKTEQLQFLSSDRYCVVRPDFDVSCKWPFTDDLAVGAAEPLVAVAGAVHAVAGVVALAALLETHAALAIWVDVMITIFGDFQQKMALFKNFALD